MQVNKTALKESTKRDKITSFLSQQKSRQVFPPLVGTFIDRAKTEPLYLKNNAWQQWNVSVLTYALFRSNLANCQSIFDVSPNSCFGKYYHCIRFIVKATCLAKKIRKWFADGRLKNKLLEYQFTGKESHLFATTLCLLFKLKAAKWKLMSSVTHSCFIYMHMQVLTY